MLKNILLQHFRSYESFTTAFDPTLNIVIGKNASGKTSLVEAIYFLSTGKSFRTSKAGEAISFGEDIAHVGAKVVTPDGEKKLEVVIALNATASGRPSKRFFVDEIARSHTSFVGFLPTVLFRPEELEIMTDGPSLRREFLDMVLEQTHKEYLRARREYDKSLRQRNALLQLCKQTGERKDDQFSYWDNILIESGQIISRFRREFLDFVNAQAHELFDIRVRYDESEISHSRLAQYAHEEVAAGVTLVGPQRDDFQVFMSTASGQKDMQSFASRGQQRLAVLQLKLLQMEYIHAILHVSPLVLLDDIFSELDTDHIQLVLSHMGQSQVILTTTHEEFVGSFSEPVKKMYLI